MKADRSYTKMPNALLRSPGLSMAEKIVYELLLSYDFSGLGCTRKQEHLAREAPCSVRALRTHLHALEKKGLVAIERGGDGRPCCYRPYRPPLAPLGPEAPADRQRLPVRPAEFAGHE